MKIVDVLLQMLCEENQCVRIFFIFCKCFWIYMKLFNPLSWIASHRILKQTPYICKAERVHTTFYFIWHSFGKMKARHVFTCYWYHRKIYIFVKTIDFEIGRRSKFSKSFLFSPWDLSVCWFNRPEPLPSTATKILDFIIHFFGNTNSIILCYLAL